ncbi:MAG TPA: hypothetical protein VGM90_38850 [Kofleriaceae bacterium]
MAGVVRSFAFAGLSLAVLGACGRINIGGVGSDGMPGDDANGDGPRVCSNPSGHDEDGDGIDDVCDLCPHRADPNQENRDHDGVGDACDPRPDTPGDSIVRFDPFTSQRADFMSLTTGMQLFDGESLQLDTRGTSWAGFYPSTIGVDTLIISGSQGVRGTAGLELLSLFVEKDPQKYQCEEYEPSPHMSYSETLDGTNYSNIDVQPLAGPPMGPFELQLAHRGPNIECRFNGSVSMAPKPAFTGDTVSINVIDEVVTLDWLIQIRSE